MYYLKGLLFSLGSVGILFLTVRFLGRYLKIGWFAFTVLFGLFGQPRQTGLTAVVGNPSLWMRPWFYLGSMIVFAGVFLFYLWRTHGL